MNRIDALFGLLSETVQVTPKTKGLGLTEAKVAIVADPSTFLTGGIRRDRLDPTD